MFWGGKMGNENENEKQNTDNGELKAEIEESTMSFDELDELLQSKLEEELSGLEAMDKEFEQIGNPDALGETIKGVVWEQFINQVAVTAGEDFIKDNRDLLNRGEKVDRNTPISDEDVKKYHLDLSKDAFIQTTENFKKGKIASHNSEIDFQQRYDDWQSNFVKNSDGNVVMHDTRIYEKDSKGNIILGADGEPVKKQVETLVSGYREPYDKERRKRGLIGNKEKGTEMDETIAAATIVRDPQANAFMTEKERIEFDLSEKNLNEIDSSWNSSKADTPTDEWLDNPNSNGQTPREIFDNLDEQSEEQLRKKYAEAKEEYEKRKNEAEQKALEAGKRSRRKEAFNIGGKALRAVVMQLLAELVKEIIGKMVLWFRSKNKSLSTLLDSLKTAIHSFVSKLKKHLVNATNTLLTTIATAIVGPVVGTINKVWMMLKQGVMSIKNAIDFLKNPKNKDIPIGIKLFEIGKIVMAGITGASAIVLGEVIEKGLMTIPPLAVEIPLIGSLANILGIFMGAVVAGIIGAIVIHMIDKATAKKRKELLNEDRVRKGNEILQTQRELHDVAVDKTNDAKKTSLDNIVASHEMADKYMREAVDEIFNDDTEEDGEIVDEYKPASSSIDFDELDSALDVILGDNNE